MADCVIYGKKLYYEDYGTGEPVIFLNGLMMSTESYRMFVPDLSKHMRILLLDLVDQGASDPADEPFSVWAHMDFITAFLAFLDLPSAHIMGMSYGGEVALAYALTYAERVRSLALYNTIPCLDEHLKAMNVLWKTAFATKDEVLIKKMLFPLVYSRKYYNSHPDRMSRLCSRKNTKLPPHYFDALIRTASSTEEFDIVEQLRKIKVPTLICGADEDMVTPLYYQNLLHEKIKDSRQIIFHETGHSAIYEQPDLFVRSLSDHIGRHTSS